MVNIVVIGAGVQGLSTACLLQLQGHNVTIIAKGTPENLLSDATYTSPKAGANWQSFAENDDYRLISWDEASFYTLWRLARFNPAGVMHLPAYQYFDDIPPNFVDPWYHRIVPGYSQVSQSDLPPGKKFGITFETVTINCPKYLDWLLSKFKSLDGKLVHAELSHIQDTLKYAKKTEIIVNCTGFGSRTLGGVMDYNIYPTRGQTVLVRAPQVKRTIGTALSTGAYRPTKQSEEESKVTYVIPREDGVVVLGGTYEANNPPKTAEEILERCIQVCPELVVNGKSPEIIEHSVGLRPTRKGGVRLDAEYLQLSGREILVVSNYGHGGYGYQSSWGCAAEVVAIIRRVIGVPIDTQVLTKFLENVFESKL
ncbi:hypothetical protein HDV05_004773 [Chytridiales sp. JEL 0842]|nr:hypothetical protein HDV05_004773 [Chytridiales sp. JEL 0842]